MLPLSMMYWTSLYMPHSPLNKGLHCTGPPPSGHGTSFYGVPLLVTPGSHPLRPAQTCPLEDLLTVLTSGGHWSTYRWQGGRSHTTGMLSCFTIQFSHCNITQHLPSARLSFSPKFDNMWTSSFAGTVPRPPLSCALKAARMSCWHFSTCECWYISSRNVPNSIRPSDKKEISKSLSHFDKSILSQHKLQSMKSQNTLAANLVWQSLPFPYWS